MLVFLGPNGPNRTLEFFPDDSRLPYAKLENEEIQNIEI
jgi:hypothetical protein